MKETLVLRAVLRADAIARIRPVFVNVNDDPFLVNHNSMMLIVPPQVALGASTVLRPNIQWWAVARRARGQRREVGHSKGIYL